MPAKSSAAKAMAQKRGRLQEFMVDQPLSPLSLCGAGAVYLYKRSVYEKTAFCPGWRVAAAGQRQPLCRDRAGPAEEPITYDNVAIPGIHLKRKKKN